MAKCGEEWNRVHQLMSEVEDLAHNLEDKAHDLVLGINANPAELSIFMAQVMDKFEEVQKEFARIGQLKGVVIA